MRQGLRRNPARTIMSFDSVPSGLVPLTYIESNRKQFITLDLPDMVNPEFYVDYEVMESVNSSRWVFGYYDLTKTPVTALGVQINPSDTTVFYTKGSAKYIVYSVPSGRTTIEIRPGSFVYNGQELAEVASTDILCDPKIALFRLWYHGPVASEVYALKSRLYSFQLGPYDMVPVLDGDEPGLLDRTTGTVYRNEGTGTFGYATEDGYVVAPT